MIKTWINDYLDLYLYAGSISDTEWQKEILHTLQRKDIVIKEEVYRNTCEELWQRFDEVSENLLQAYRQLCQNRTLSLVQTMQERVVKLRWERKYIINQIRCVHGLFSSQGQTEKRRAV
jgi:hypothetical protein